MKLSDITTPQGAASARARDARLLASGGTVRGGDAPGAWTAVRRLAPLSVAFALGLALGLGAGAGLLSEPSLTSDVVRGVHE